MATTKVTLKALVTVDFLGRVPAFALRQLAAGDERMPVNVEFEIERGDWPKEQMRVSCAHAADVIAFVRELAKDELQKRGETLPPSDAVDPHGDSNTGTPTPRETNS